VQMNAVVALLLALGALVGDVTVKAAKNPVA
jgi:hypothetical protein